MALRAAAEAKGAELAGELDSAKGSRTTGRRALVATLIFAGPRVSEACDLPWIDVNLAAGRIGVGRSKTDAGMREIDMLPVLRDELTTYRASRRGRDDHSDRVFTTAAGTPRDKDNVRSKVLEPVIARADEILEGAGLAPLPAGVTAHKLRHTFTSLLFAIGKDPVYVMQQLGHTDPKFTLRVYAHMMRRSEEERERLRDLVEGRLSPDEWALTGTKNDDGLPEEAEHPDGRGWFRTSDLSRVKRALSH